ncbi:hypothetical protein ATKI12_2877 [Kitasatospora sp. Ki12]
MWMRTSSKHFLRRADPIVRALGLHHLQAGKLERCSPKG